MSSNNVNPFDLTIVNQNNCGRLNSTMRVEINDNTFSSKNIGDAVRKVGSKIGEGVTYVIDSGKKAYQKVYGTKEDRGLPDAEVEWMP